MLLPGTSLASCCAQLCQLTYLLGQDSVLLGNPEKLARHLLAQNYGKCSVKKNANSVSVLLLRVRIPL
jgi:hypothetical protein